MSFILNHLILKNIRLLQDAVGLRHVETRETCLCHTFELRNVDVVPVFHVDPQPHRVYQPHLFCFAFQMFPVNACRCLFDLPAMTQKAQHLQVCVLPSFATFTMGQSSRRPTTHGLDILSPRRIWADRDYLATFLKSDMIGFMLFTAG